MGNNTCNSDLSNKNLESNISNSKDVNTNTILLASHNNSTSATDNDTGNDTDIDTATKVKTITTPSDNLTTITTSMTNEPHDEQYDSQLNQQSYLMCNEKVGYNNDAISIAPTATHMNIDSKVVSKIDASVSSSLSSSSPSSTSFSSSPSTPVPTSTSTSVSTSTSTSPLLSSTRNRIPIPLTIPKIPTFIQKQMISSTEDLSNNLFSPQIHFTPAISKTTGINTRATAIATTTTTATGIGIGTGAGIMTSIPVSLSTSAISSILPPSASLFSAKIHENNSNITSMTTNMTVTTTDIPKLSYIPSVDEVDITNQITQLAQLSHLSQLTPRTQLSQIEASLFPSSVIDNYLAKIHNRQINKEAKDAGFRNSGSGNSRDTPEDIQMKETKDIANNTTKIINTKDTTRNTPVENTSNSSGIFIDYLEKVSMHRQKALQEQKIQQQQQQQQQLQQQLQRQAIQQQQESQKYVRFQGDQWLGMDHPDSQASNTDDDADIDTDIDTDTDVCFDIGVNMPNKVGDVMMTNRLNKDDKDDKYNEYFSAKDQIRYNIHEYLENYSQNHNDTNNNSDSDNYYNNTYDGYINYNNHNINHVNDSAYNDDINYHSNNNDNYHNHTAYNYIYNQNSNYSKNDINNHSNINNNSDSNSNNNNNNNYPKKRLSQLLYDPYKSSTPNFTPIPPTPTPTPKSTKLAHSFQFQQSQSQSQSQNQRQHHDLCYYSSQDRIQTEDQVDSLQSKQVLTGRNPQQKIQKSNSYLQPLHSQTLSPLLLSMPMPSSMAIPIPAPILTSVERVDKDFKRLDGTDINYLNHDSNNDGNILTKRHRDQQNILNKLNKQTHNYQRQKKNTNRYKKDKFEKFENIQRQKKAHKVREIERNETKKLILMEMNKFNHFEKSSRSLISTSVVNRHRLSHDVSDGLESDSNNSIDIHESNRNEDKKSNEGNQDNESNEGNESNKNNENNESNNSNKGKGDEEDNQDYSGEKDEGSSSKQENKLGNQTFVGDATTTPTTMTNAITSPNPTMFSSHSTGDLQYLFQRNHNSKHGDGMFSDGVGGGDTNADTSDEISVDGSVGGNIDDIMEHDINDNINNSINDNLNHAKSVDIVDSDNPHNLKNLTNIHNLINLTDIRESITIDKSSFTLPNITAENARNTGSTRNDIVGNLSTVKQQITPTTAQNIGLNIEFRVAANITNNNSNSRHQEQEHVQVQELEHEHNRHYAHQPHATAIPTLPTHIPNIASVTDVSTRSPAFVSAPTTTSPPTFAPSSSSIPNSTPNSTPNLIPVPYEGKKYLFIGMVGLPARGKSFLSNKIARYLRWIGYSAKIYNLGQYRREYLQLHATFPKEEGIVENDGERHREGEGEREVLNIFNNNSNILPTSLHRTQSTTSQNSFHSRGSNSSSSSSSSLSASSHYSQHSHYSHYSHSSQFSQFSRSSQFSQFSHHSQFSQFSHYSHTSKFSHTTNTNREEVDEREGGRERGRKGEKEKKEEKEERIRGEMGTEIDNNNTNNNTPNSISILPSSSFSPVSPPSPPSPPSPSPSQFGCNANFFSEDNPIGAQLREELAILALYDAISYFQNGGQCAIYDATNTTIARRNTVRSILTSSGLPIEIVWVESICDDEKTVLDTVCNTKFSSPDYLGCSHEYILQDFYKRIENYERQYEPLEKGELIDDCFIKMIDVGQRFETCQVRGYLPTKLIFFLMNVTLQKGAIYLVQPGMLDMHPILKYILDKDDNTSIATTPMPTLTTTATTTTQSYTTDNIDEFDLIMKSYQLMLTDEGIFQTEMLGKKLLFDIQDDIRTVIAGTGSGTVSGTGAGTKIRVETGTETKAETEAETEALRVTTQEITENKIKSQKNTKNLDVMINTRADPETMSKSISKTKPNTMIDVINIPSIQIWSAFSPYIKQTATIIESVLSSSPQPPSPLQLSPSVTTPPSALTLTPIPTLKTKLVQWRALSAQHRGIYDTIPLSIISILDPTLYAEFYNDPLNCKFPQGESYREVIDRAERIIFELERQKDPVVVIAHSSVLKCVYGYYTDLNVHQIPKIIIPNSQIVKIVPAATGTKSKIIPCAEW